MTALVSVACFSWSFFRVLFFVRDVFQCLSLTQLPFHLDSSSYLQVPSAEFFQVLDFSLLFYQNRFFGFLVLTKRVDFGP